MPLLPGRKRKIKLKIIFYSEDILISPRHLAKRLTDLSDQETADIFTVAKKLQKMIETIYETNSTTLCVQDGPFAGQTIEVRIV